MQEIVFSLISYEIKYLYNKIKVEDFPVSVWYEITFFLNHTNKSKI